MNRLHQWYCSSHRWKAALGDLLPWALEDVDLGDHVLELGPGPGPTTQVLTQRAGRVTSVEIDPAVALALRRRFGGTDVGVVRGDATCLPLRSAAFTGVVAFTMLHHIRTRELQDRLLGDVARVLRPGGLFVGFDVGRSIGLRLFHLGDTLTLVDPETFGARLEASGFHGAVVDPGRGFFRFRAQTIRRAADKMRPAAAVSD